MKTRGFTLLEVMIAVAILGLSLTAIFSSEVGAVNVALRAKRQNVAASLARCKMLEIEELIAAEGLPAVEKSGQDSCCEHAPVDGYACDWIVERIILPDMAGGEGEDDFEPSAELDLDTIQEQVGDPDEVMQSGVSNLASLALQLGYPIMKPSLEEQVRRATVSVYWLEGEPRGFDVVQFLVAEQPSSPIEQAVSGAASDDPSASGDQGTGAGATGTGTGAEGQGQPGQGMSPEERLRMLQELLRNQR